jgi:SpoVK/Ycf46/Vps4 family AAA+-type ATPase
MLDTNVSPKAMSELSVILIEKFISFSLFYLSFKLVTSTLSTSLKKLLEIINEVKDPSSSSSSTSMNIVPSYIMKFLKPNITLNSYELELLNTMVDPSRIDTTIYDIGGLDNVKRSLFNLFNNNTSINSISTSTSSSSRTLYRPVKSVLLYGPPGCGKCNQLHLIYDT